MDDPDAWSEYGLKYPPADIEVAVEFIEVQLGYASVPAQDKPHRTAEGDPLYVFGAYWREYPASGLPPIHHAAATLSLPSPWKVYALASWAQAVRRKSHEPSTQR